MRTSPNDPQQKRLYRWEHAMGDTAVDIETLMELKDAQDFVDYVWKRHARRRRRSNVLLRTPPPRVCHPTDDDFDDDGIDRPNENAMGYWGFQNLIYMPWFRLGEWSLLHETAHALIRQTWSGDHVSHGPEFCRLLVVLLSENHLLDDPAKAEARAAKMGLTLAPVATLRAMGLRALTLSAESSVTRPCASAPAKAMAA